MLIAVRDRILECYSVNSSNIVLELICLGMQKLLSILLACTANLSWTVST